MSDDNGGVASWVALSVCLSLLAVTGVAATPSSPAAPAVATAAPGDPLHGEVETDVIAIEVSARPDGNATWRIEYRTELGADGNTTEAFESLAADVRANPENYTDRFADRIRGTVRDAENATGREMSATDFDVSVETSPIYGIVAYTFEWSNFGNVTGSDRVVLGDAVAGFVMNADTQLLFRWPREWAVTAVDPEPDVTGDRSVRWDGDSTDFGPDQPRVVIRRSAGTPTATRTATPTEGPGDGTRTPTDPGTTVGAGGGGGGGGGGLPLGLIGVLVLFAAAVGVAWWHRPGTPGAPPSGPDDGPAPSATDDTDDSPAAADGTDDDGGPTPDVDEALLSNEERVLRVLEENGGRAKQQEVVEELGWTDAKTSQVVSGMREEGTIDGFRLGRENVLTLPDEDIDPTERDDGDI